MKTTDFINKRPKAQVQESVQQPEVKVVAPEPTMPQFTFESAELQYNESVEEYSPVASAITQRIKHHRTDLLKYGLPSVLAAIEDVANWAGDVEEIGNSDINAWVKQVERMLKENPPEAFEEGEEQGIDETVQSPQQISFDQLPDSEGLVLLGAGGDPREWINGVFGIWQEEGLTTAQSPEEVFSDAYMLKTTGGRTDLVLPFSNGAKLAMGKLAMWRLRFGDASWISDYKDNYAGQHGVEEGQVNELSKNTLGNYVKKASVDAKFKGYDAGAADWGGDEGSKHPSKKTWPGAKLDNKAHSRLKGISKATDRLVKEDASAGGTSSSSVAATVQTLGEKGNFSKKDVNKKLGGYTNQLSKGGVVKAKK